MQSACTGLHAPPAAITMLPLIDMKPGDESCIYSTLLFVDSQATKLPMPAACVTFDQPLWLKAVEISKAAALNSIVCRLDGFHLLMSFLGSIGTVMHGSGLQELMGFVYGCDAVQHMLSGKAVSRALRAYLLIQSALITLLLQRIIPRPTGTQELAEITDDIALTADDVDHLVNLCNSVLQSPQDYNQTDILQCASLQTVDQQLQSIKQQVSASSQTAKLPSCGSSMSIMLKHAKCSSQLNALATGICICKQASSAFMIC